MIAAQATAVRRRATRAFAFLLASAALAATGCQGPCESLAEKICSCEINGSQEQSCLLRMQRVGDRDVSTTEAERCSNLLDTCDCDALDREDYAACGITNEG